MTMPGLHAADTRDRPLYESTTSKCGRVYPPVDILALRILCYRSQTPSEASS